MQELNKNAEKLRLAARRAGLSYHALADFLSERSGSIVSTNTVGRWLAPPHSRERSACPDWPVEVMRQAGYIDDDEPPIRS